MLYLDVCYMFTSSHIYIYLIFMLLFSLYLSIDTFVFEGAVTYVTPADVAVDPIPICGVYELDPVSGLIKSRRLVVCI